MGKINLGHVVGKDAGFGDVSATYIDDGGSPSVDIQTSGEDSQKDFQFIFKNLINEPMDSSQVDQILNDTSLVTSRPLSGTGLVKVWTAIKEMFAKKVHTHKASDINEGTFPAARIEDGAIAEDKLADAAVATGKIADAAVTAAKIANGAVGQNQLDPDVRDSISRIDGKLTKRAEIALTYIKGVGGSAKIGQLPAGVTPVRVSGYFVDQSNNICMLPHPHCDSDYAVTVYVSESREVFLSVGSKTTIRSGVLAIDYIV